LQAQADVLENADKERRSAIAAFDQRLQELAGMEKRGSAEVDAMRKDLAAMEKRKGDYAQAEAQMKQWQEIEKRLRGQLVELEEKHEIMRRGLNTDEATVLIFANDLIKRIDLIDVLIQRYTGTNGGGIDQQLRTLRASFEDILHQHGVTEFEIAPGTEVDVAMRHRISIMDSVPGKSKPKVIENYRPGFIYSHPDGREIILRKVEVKTSSQ
jgi:molecular chaperone GrpE (heat shock protein)